MKNKMILFAGAFAGIAPQAMAAHKAVDDNKNERPNVIVILTDDQGYGDLGCFGSKIKTPNIDNIAKHGMRFTDFYVGANVSTPSRAALMTGCYPPRVNMPHVIFPEQNVCLAENEQTMAEMFKTAGYHTGIVGKWHLGARNEGLPTHHGFDEFYGLPYSHDMVSSAFLGFVNDPNKKLDRPVPYPPLPLYNGNEVEEYDPAPSSLTQRYTKYAVDFINRNKKEPFFLYLAHNLPHVPLAVSKDFEGKSGLGLYGDVITELDWSIGEVRKALKKNGLDKNTLVIYISDNGPWLLFGNHGGTATPLREGKGTTFDGGHRVFCVMEWPAQIPAGKTCTEVATSMDILPTMARYTGTKLSGNKIDGMDILPLMQNKKGAKTPHDAYYYFKGKICMGVRCGDFKFLMQHMDPVVTIPGRDGLRGEQKPSKIERSLYNLRKDIGETNNIIKQFPKKALEMEKLVKAMNKDIAENSRPCGTIK